MTNFLKSDISQLATNFENANAKEAVSARLIWYSTLGANMTYGYYTEGDEFKEALEAVNKLPML